MSTTEEYGDAKRKQTVIEQPGNLKTITDIGSSLTIDNTYAKGFIDGIQLAAGVIDSELLFHVHGKTAEHKAAVAHLTSLRNKILNLKNEIKTKPQEKYY